MTDGKKPAKKMTQAQFEEQMENAKKIIAEYNSRMKKAEAAAEVDAKKLAEAEAVIKNLETQVSLFKGALNLSPAELEKYVATVSKLCHAVDDRRRALEALDRLSVYVKHARDNIQSGIPDGL